MSCNSFRVTCAAVRLKLREVLGGGTIWSDSDSRVPLLYDEIHVPALRPYGEAASVSRDSNYNTARPVLLPRCQRIRPRNISAYDQISGKRVTPLDPVALPVHLTQASKLPSHESHRCPSILLPYHDVSGTKRAQNPRKLETRHQSDRNPYTITWLTRQPYPSAHQSRSRFRIEQPIVNNTIPRQSRFGKRSAQSIATGESSVGREATTGYPTRLLPPTPRLRIGAATGVARHMMLRLRAAGRNSTSNLDDRLTKREQKEQHFLTPASNEAAVLYDRLRDNLMWLFLRNIRHICLFS
ncbi:hypothetical protein GE09DRAFT_709488 [Coniochaeta sp. 2T2.1]|nr:hypothetical protein GE09DRAFT_709488 [Coniochaeta sp. 2T2.1]